jgi:hypothetical protein
VFSLIASQALPFAEERNPILNELHHQQIPKNQVEIPIDKPASRERPSQEQLSAQTTSTRSWTRPTRGALLATILLGGLSSGLYLLLFIYSDTLPELAAATREGSSFYALVPLAIALVFSFVHGAFTGRFWDLLGLKARK